MIDFTNMAAHASDVPGVESANQADTLNNQFAFHEEPYRFVSLEDVYEQTCEVQWLIENYIPKNSIGMLYGPSSIGKTHIVLDMATKIATGIPWCENDTEQGLVLVMAGEGHTGFKRRLQAIEDWNDFTIDRSNLRFSERPISIDTDKGINEIIVAIDALEKPPSLIIIDTLSRHLTCASENSNEEMARVIKRLDQIKRRYGCTIMIIHHTGKKESSGARGAYSLYADIDFMFALEKDGPKAIELICKKQKDADDQVEELFQILPVTLNETDSKGRPIVGACASRCRYMSFDEAKTLDSIALESFAPVKSDWQAKFIEMYDEQVNKDLKLDSKKKIFRAIVSDLVEHDMVIQHSRTEFELAPPEDDEEG